MNLTSIDLTVSAVTSLSFPVYPYRCQARDVCCKAHKHIVTWQNVRRLVVVLLATAGSDPRVWWARQVVCAEYVLWVAVVMTEDNNSSVI